MHQLTFVNSLFSRNLCIDGQDPVKRRDVSPLTVFIPSVTGGQLWDSDQVRFVDPSHDIGFFPYAPLGGTTPLFDAIFDSTYYSDIGKDGAGNLQACTTERRNFHDDRLLVTVPFLAGPGLVFPATPTQWGTVLSPVIDRGIVHGGIPTDPTDVRLALRTVAYVGTEVTPDVGALEVQEDE